MFSGKKNEKNTIAKRFHWFEVVWYPVHAILSLFHSKPKMLCPSGVLTSRDSRYMYWFLSVFLQIFSNFNYLFLPLYFISLKNILLSAFYPAVATLTDRLHYTFPKKVRKIKKFLKWRLVKWRSDCIYVFVLCLMSIWYLYFHLRYHS